MRVRKTWPWPSWLGGLLVAGAGWAGPDTDLGLVRVADVWRWRLATTGTDALPVDWSAREWSDMSWGEARSGFAGDYAGGEATRLSYLPLSGPVCLRKQFDVADPADVAWLVLRVDWTGGFVAYLNGVEIARRNLPGDPGTPVPFETVPVPRAKGLAEALDCSFAIPRLRPGGNVLAIQWHPSPGAYGSGLVPELLANFTRGPFVQNTTSTSQTIVWRTPVPASTIVEFGPTAELGQRVHDPTPVPQHAATLTGLVPDTEYCYRVRSGDGRREGVSPLLWFRTLKESGPLRFAVTADVGTGNLAQWGVAEVMRAMHPDLVLIAGDTLYPTFLDTQADQRLFSIYRHLMTSTPFFVVAGNHDYWSSRPQEFYEAFVLPTNNVPPALHALAGTGPEHYYAFDHGDAHFVGLYVPLYYRGLELAPGTVQYQWLEADLAASTKPWKFLFLHLPLMSSGPHADDDYNLNGVPDMQELADALLPLASRYGVQMVFSGHDHSYQRFRPVQGVHCLVAAGGGGTLYPLAALHPDSAQFLQRWHAVLVTVSGNSLQARALSETGELVDLMFIERVPPPAVPRETVWHTPSAAFEGEPDGDGNRTGQRWDFPGEAIPTAPGSFSNLGRVQVARDHGDLHIGFERVMLPRNGNLFLFLESPSLPGVTSLAGLGNGVVDPSGQGVDGLDFLENLSFSFRNFRPALAAVLGDEFADGQFRDFARTNITVSGFGEPIISTNLDLNIGQGVFWLEAGLSDVPGARIAQFNRSPQTGPVPGEQNADFIVVSLPLAELGLRGGETIRLAAVVGGGEFSTNATAQARELDRAFLGSRLEGTGLGPVALEGLEVRIGPDLDPDGDGLLSTEELGLGTNPDNPDSDSDGLPDGWEVRHHLNPLSGEGLDGARGDPDADGFPNAAEWAAGTAPDDARSVLRLAVRRRLDGALEFRWPVVSPRQYRLETADAPEGPYTPVLPTEPVTDATAREALRVLPGPDPARATQWYRVVLLSGLQAVTMPQ